jgi:hypothetical protein
MLHRLAWGVFVVIGGLGVFASLGPLFVPTDLSAFRLMGQDPSSLEAAAAQPFTTFLGRWIGTSMVAGNLFTVGIALTALRRGERWAACLMLYWPAMFLTHFVMYGPGPMRQLQVFWLLLSSVSVAHLLLQPPPHVADARA